MKLVRKRGDASVILNVFIQDSSSTTGAGLTGLTNASAGLTAYFKRELDATATAITLVGTGTVGAFTSSQFLVIDGTNMPGWYQFCPPDTACGSADASKFVVFHLKGATNMAPLPMEVQLVAVNVEDTVRFGLTALPNAAAEAAGGLYTRGSGAGQIAQTTNGRVDSDAKTIANAAIASATFAAAAIDAAAIATDAITSAELAQSAADKILATACTEPTAIPAASPTAIAALSFLLTLARNKITQTATTQTLRNDADLATIATYAVSDDATTFTRAKGI